MTKRLFEPDGPDETGREPRPLGQRLLWMAGLALASLGIVAVTAYVLRGLLFIG